MLRVEEMEVVEEVEVEVVGVMVDWRCTGRCLD